ncbi:DUF4190 domain-containing protein [Saccharopolyspora sp. NFXS83]|uniref:DUF4190 domain-containing protein n=1 Tax=Saccharopolyspora sp. NFXS83 TaxID=2993560 RepID=UPI00224B2E93|nr:DUF4190 domain-containing protein [Saccharopolyspora sp. NFXS83]MCX2732920.1 DUF4190 domain-containing protein [Saccharopolyspora sp. NFXS83]
MSAVVPPPTTPKNGLGTAGFVLGLLALLFSFIPFIGVVAWPLGILGLVFGVLGIVRARNGQANNQGMAITGTVLAGIGLLICIAWVGVVGSVANETAEQSESLGIEPQHSPVPAGDATPEVIELGFGEAHTWRGGEAVRVAAPTEHQPSSPYLIDSDSRGVAVDLTITNGTKHEINPISWEVTATHGGRPAEFSIEDRPFTNAQIPPGGALTITRIFQVAPGTADLRISVAPSAFATDTAYFHGDF